MGTQELSLLLNYNKYTGIIRPHLENDRGEFVIKWKEGNIVLPNQTVVWWTFQDEDGLLWIDKDEFISIHLSNETMQGYVLEETTLYSRMKKFFDENSEATYGNFIVDEYKSPSLSNTVWIPRSEWDHLKDPINY